MVYALDAPNNGQAGFVSVVVAAALVWTYM